MSNDYCKTKSVTLQENGIVRDSEGIIIGRMEKDVKRDSIVTAVAQAWCTPENEHKVMDPVLAESIVANVVELKEMYPPYEYYEWEAIVGFLDEYWKIWEYKGLTIGQIRKAI